MPESSDWSAEPGRLSPGGSPPSRRGRPKPGVIPLRPLLVSEILDGAISYVRSNLAVTLGFSAAVITITQLVELPVTRLLLGRIDAAFVASDGDLSDEQLLGLIGSSLSGLAVSSLISFVAITVLSGLLIMVLGQAVLGRRMSLDRAWAAIRGRIPGLLGLSLLATLLLVLVMALGLAPLVIAVAVGATSGGTILAAVAVLIVAAGVVVYLAVAWSMVTPAYVLEHVPVLRAFRRSMDLVRRTWWRVFGILLLAGIIAAVVGFLLGLPFGFVSTLVDGSPDPASGPIVPSLAASVVAAVGTILASTITAPFSAGVTGLLYFDQRMRREAFDLELLAATETPGGPATARGPATSLPPDPSDSGPDLRKPDRPDTSAADRDAGPPPP